MKNKRTIRVLAFMLVAVMLIGMVPLSALAAESGFVSETHEVFSTTNSTIAPGITQSINYAYSNDGKQMVYYVATADVTRDDVVVQTAYKEQYVNGSLGMEKLTNQMAFADDLYTDPTSDRYISDYYKAVVGVNASFYNMTTGQPTGVTFLDGIQIGESSSYNQIFAIMKDGTAVIDYVKNIDKSQIWQSVAGSQMLVYGGKDVTKSIGGSYNTDRHSRTCVGVTADGKVVVMSLDGRQEPFSCGGTMHELAQIMLEQGCVAAINLDGGGSTTFAARQEGQNDVSIVNRPSDGSERSISAGLIIASLAMPSDTFDRASLKAENVFVTPGSTVKISATGVSPAGTAATIPDDVDWQLADSKYGSVENGVFVSNGTVGAVEIQMTYNGAVVGSTVVNVVVPDSLEFNNSAVTVPYGKTVVIGLTALYGLNEVALKDSDIAFTLSDTSIGTFDGLSFTAGVAGVAAATSDVTAAFTFAPEITATAVLNLGKGSEVIFDFEDGTTGGLLFSEPVGTQYNYVWPESNQWAVTAEEGKVHSGNYAMKAWVNYSNSLESGYQKTSLVGPAVPMVFENATRVGMWIYVPEEAVGVWARWTIQGATEKDANGDYKWSGITGQDMDDTAGGTGVVSSFQESGWHYLSIDTSAYAAVRLHSGAIMQFYISDRDGSAYNYDASDYPNITGNFTFYMDDITIDNSEAVDDRDAPKFSSVVYADEFTNDAPELNGQTTGSNILSFTATVADKVAANATGLNPDTAKAYIDGVPVDFTYADGKLAITDVKLADGKHTVKFSICDNMGNYGVVIREINVKANSDIATVKMVAHDASLDRILHGSIYYIDLVATDIDTAKSVVVSIDLDSLSTWQLDHMELADGFEASYSIDADDNIATIEITRTGDVDAEGEAVLASIPVRIWQLKTGYTYPNGTKIGKPAFTSKQFRDMKEFWRISLTANVEYGLLTNLDDTTSSFSGDSLFVDTEMWAEDADMIATPEGTAYYNSWNGGHVHTAVAIADKAATCTEAGYTGRTYCDGCKSVVDWGTTVPATGHTPVVEGSTIKCGECDAPVTGLVGLVEIDGAYYYVQNNTLRYGWFVLNEVDTYYFNPVDYKAVNGTQRIASDIGTRTYRFEDYKLVEGEIVNTHRGPYYAWGGAWLNNKWFEYQGKTYFASNDFVLLTGLALIRGSSVPYCEAYLFDENGALIKPIVEDGVFTQGTKTIYIEDGHAVIAGLVQDDEGNYYYIDSTFKAVLNKTRKVTKTNGLLPEGTYTFGADGKMVNPPSIKNGIVLDDDGYIRYYVDGEPTAPGVVKDAEGNYYYIGSSLYATTNNTRFLSASKTNGLLPEGTYTFGADGKIVFETVDPDEPDEPVAPKNGIILDDDGYIRYYENGTVTAPGVVKDAEGNYYYFGSSMYATTNNTRFLSASKTNGLLPEGTYTFGADGKIVIETVDPDEPDEPVAPKNGIILDDDGYIRYYENGVATAPGVVKDAEGNYYYFGSSLYATTNNTRFLSASKTNGLLPEGTYTFGADGKIVLNPVEPDEPEEPGEVKNGLIEENGELYYYVDGALKHAGLIFVDGSFYYINSSCVAVRNITRYVNEAWANGLLPAGEYTFDADGKMILD